MASRTVWKGFLQFSLVSIPVKAYTASASGGGRISLNQLHKDCNSRIQYKKTCPQHGEVPADQIVSGYEFAEDQYVIIEPDEIEKIRSPKEKSVNIESFVAADSIDPAYYNGTTWYLTPDGPIGQKPYALLRKVMTESERVAFARLVLRGKQQLLMVRPTAKNLMAATMLAYDQELKDPTEFEAEVVATEVEPGEMKLAKTLTDQLVAREFNIADYADDYSEKLQQLIEAKVKGKQVVEPPAAADEPGQVINLMEALQASLAKAKSAGAPKAGKPPKLTAPGTAEKAAASARKRKTS